MAALAMNHEVDPRDALLSGIGELDGIDVHLNKVVVAIYKRPEQTKGGIFMPKTVQEEDVYRGLVGLVVKAGPIAFQDDGRVAFGGALAAAGDWVLFKKHAGIVVNLNGVACRVIDDTDVWMTVPNPDVVV